MGKRQKANLILLFHGWIVATKQEVLRERWICRTVTERSLPMLGFLHRQSQWFYRTALSASRISWFAMLQSVKQNYLSRTFCPSKRDRFYTSELLQYTISAGSVREEGLSFSETAEEISLKNGLLLVAADETCSIHRQTGQVETKQPENPTWDLSLFLLWYHKELIRYFLNSIPVI